MRCPVCDTDNLEAAAECASCGKVLRAAAGDALPESPAIDGLVPTHVAEAELAVAVEAVPDLERTPLDHDPSAPLSWTAGPLALERTAFVPESAGGLVLDGRSGTGPRTRGR